MHTIYYLSISVIYNVNVSLPECVHAALELEPAYAKIQTNMSYSCYLNKSIVKFKKKEKFSLKK